MAQAAIKVGQAFIPIEVDFTGVNKKVAKSVARTMNYASKTATLPIRHTMFAGAAPAFTRALTRANFTADALFKGKFSNRLNKGLSQSLATAMSRTSVPVNANMFSGLAGAFQKGMKGGAVEPSSMFKGGLGGFSNFGRAAYSAFIATFTVGSALTARTAIKSYGEFERAQLGLTSMLKSTEKANKLLKDIQDFAVVSPFNVQNLLDASKQLVAFRFKTEEIIPLMQDIGDAAAALGTGDEGIQRMIRAMGQIKVKGRVMAEELLQLNEIGVSGPHFLAEHLGITTDEALKRVNKGQVDAATGLEALRKGMQKYFGGSIKVQEGTLFGLWSNLKDQFEIAARMLFAPLSDDAKGLLKGTIERLEKVRKWAENDWPAIVQKFRDDPKQAIRDMAKSMYAQFTQQDWSGAFTKIRAVFTPGFDLAKEVPWGDLWRDFRGKAWDAYLYVKHLDWPGIWAKTESAGASFAASLKSYDWKGLGATIKGEVLDAWETGKNIADYLKGKFEQIDWSGIGTNIADKLGAARQKIVDKLQAAIDDGLGDLSGLIDKTDWGAAGTRAGNTVGENVRSAIKWTIDTSVDIGRWLADKITGFDYEKHLTNAGDFARGFSRAFTAALLGIDEATLDAEINALIARVRTKWAQLHTEGPEAATLELRVSIRENTEEMLAKSKELGEIINTEVNKIAVEIRNYDVDEAKVKESGEKAGNTFAAAALSSVEFWEPIADDLFSYDPHEITDAVVDGIDDVVKALTDLDTISDTFWAGFEDSAIGASVKALKTGVKVIAGVVYAAFMGLAGLITGIVVSIGNFVNGAVDTIIESFNKLTGLNIPKVGRFVNTQTNPDRRFEGFDFGSSIKDNLSYFFPHLFDPATKYPLAPQNPVQNGAEGDYNPYYPAGKSANIEVHQHFEGRYMEPRQAQRAAMIGIKAGV